MPTIVLLEEGCLKRKRTLFLSINEEKIRKQKKKMMKILTMIIFIN
ncbi:hypothetical protein I656_01857 [Geobacillus sp. WSUCF1]|nr:hypothetical protein I656_01857 [Geobacillus sp. WSUCF1]